MTTANSTPITRTSAGIRSALLDELDSIRAGTSNPSRANAVARLTGGVTSSVTSLALARPTRPASARSTSNRDS
jgi:hypothetical protein